jgi:lysozyme
MLFELLKFEEGYREKAYLCSEGYPTIGIGTKLGPKNSPLSNYTVVVTEHAAKALLDDEVKKIRNELVKHRWYIELDSDRQTIIKSMAYQLGCAGLFKFKKMIAALEIGDYAEASRQALDSKWSRQTAWRAYRHAAVILTGNLMATYEGLIDG